MNRKIQKDGGHKSASEIAALVDKVVRLDSDIRKFEHECREIRAKLKQAGRLDLARKYLEAPTALKDLAGLFWRNEALVTIEKKDGSDANIIKPVSAADFPEKQFMLIRSDGVRGKKITTVVRSDGQPAVIRLSPIGPLIETAEAKIRSNFAERSKAAQRMGNRASSNVAAKEAFIELAPLLFEFEECACIFPDAALAGDYDFIERILARFHDRHRNPLEDRDVKTFGLYWHGFETIGAADMVPPLKHWSNKAACEFVRFWFGEDKLKLEAYQQRKSRCKRYSEKPTLVTWAEYIREGSTQCLMCKR